MESKITAWQLEVTEKKIISQEILTPTVTPPLPVTPAPSLPQACSSGCRERVKSEHGGTKGGVEGVSSGGGGGGRLCVGWEGCAPSWEKARDVTVTQGHAESPTGTVCIITSLDLPRLAYAAVALGSFSRLY